MGGNDDGLEVGGSTCLQIYRLELTPHRRHVAEKRDLRRPTVAGRLDGPAAADCNPDGLQVGQETADDPPDLLPDLL